jgi:hypothetical protein
MKFIKIFIIAAIIFAVSLGKNVCDAQVVAFQSDAGSLARLWKIQGAVKFSVMSSNKTMMVGSTNLVHCRLENSSTNKIQILFDKPTFSNLIIMDTPVQHPVDIKKIRFLLPQQPRRLENHSLNVGEAYEWDEPIIIGDNIKPRNYRLSIVVPILMPPLTDGFGYGCPVYGILEGVEIVKPKGI